MSAVAHFFVAVSGSFIHERMAQLFVDIYTHRPPNPIEASGERGLLTSKGLFHRQGFLYEC